MKSKNNRKIANRNRRSVQKGGNVLPFLSGLIAPQGLASFITVLALIGLNQITGKKEGQVGGGNIEQKYGKALRKYKKYLVKNNYSQQGGNLLDPTFLSALVLFLVNEGMQKKRK